MARSVTPIKAKEETLRLKETRDEKLRKDELDLALTIYKAEAAHVNVLFSWDKREKESSSLPKIKYGLRCQKLKE